ncbi:10994_t:CDS:2, partial [Cetraspora pellucida]
ECSELCLRLFLLAGQSADECGFEEICYESFVQAFTIYEESISESRIQFQAITLIIGTLQTTSVFGPENYDTLITKCALHGSKLLKKPDQCRAVYLSSHLWWATEIEGRNNRPIEELYRDGKRVLECLQKALKIADSCMDSVTNVELFVEILNRYIYYFERKNEA